jgi:hypothetical protein
LTLPEPNYQLIRGHHWKMKLSEELNACAYKGTTDRFKALLLETMRADFPMLTIDAVLSTPAAATRFCEVIRETSPSANLHDAIILRTLMTIRKRKECPVKLIGGPSKVKLSKLLADSGCPMGVDEFRKVVAACLSSMFNGRSIHDVLCHPREALALCEYVRSKSKAEVLPHTLILKVLLSIRKK